MSSFSKRFACTLLIFFCFQVQSSFAGTPIPDQLKIVGRGIQNRSSRQLVLLSCVGPKNGGEASCSSLRLVQIDSNQMPYWLGQSFPADNLIQVKEELKKLFEETWVTDLFQFFSSAQVYALTSSNGWNWANNPLEIKRTQYKKVVSTLLYFAEANHGREVANNQAKSLMVSKTVVDCSSKLMELAPNLTSVAATQLCTAKGTLGTHEVYQTCVVNTFKGAYRAGTTNYMSDDQMVEACVGGLSESIQIYSLMSEIQKSRSDFSQEQAYFLGTAAGKGKLGSLGKDYEVCVLENAKTYFKITDPNAFVANCVHLIKVSSQASTKKATNLLEWTGYYRLPVSFSGSFQLSYKGGRTPVGSSSFGKCDLVSRTSDRSSYSSIENSYLESVEVEQNNIKLYFFDTSFFVECTPYLTFKQFQELVNGRIQITLPKQ